MNPLFLLLPFSDENFDNDFEEKTPHGVNRLELMVNFISVIEAKEKEVAPEYEKLKLWLQSQIGRPLTNKEELNLAQGIVNYLQSDIITEQRMAAMKYLFNTEFLNP